MEQFKEVVVSKTKESSKNKVERIFSKFYDYVFKRIKTEKIIKNSLIVEQAEFIKNINNDLAVAEIRLYSDLSKQTHRAFVINPLIPLVSGQTVLAGYWNTTENLFILGPIEKKGVVSNVTS